MNAVFYFRRNARSVVNLSKHRNSIYSQKKKKKNKIKVALITSRSQSITPRGREKRKKVTHTNKRINAREAYRSALSFHKRGDHNAKQDLTHISLASHFVDIGKQCRPRSDAAERGLHCLLIGISIKNKIKMKKVHQLPLKNGNGLVQLIRMD